jgi:hypothetical protein
MNAADVKGRAHFIAFAVEVEKSTVLFICIATYATVSEIEPSPYSFVTFVS